MASIRLFLTVVTTLAPLAACVGGSSSADVEDGEHDGLGGKSDSVIEGSAQARGILALVNDPAIGVRELDLDVGLSSRAARNIIEHRDGADVEPGTADDDLFDTIAELDAIPYIGPVTMQVLLDEAVERGLVEEEAKIAVAWHFKSFAGVAAGCPSGFDTIAVNAQAIDQHGEPVGLPSVDLFDCAAGQGQTAELPPTRYRVWLSVANHAVTSVYADSTSSIVDLRTSDGTYDAAILTDGGYFSLAWELRGASSGDSLACEDVPGLDGVETIATSVATPSAAIIDKFTCSDYAGVTAGLLAGTYTVSVDAFTDASGGAALGTAPALVNRVIRAPNQVTALGTIVIPVDGL